MKRNLLITVFVVIWISAFSQEHKKLELKKETVEYTLNKGMLNGKYVSFYKNGNKKSEGKYKNNNRIGVWTIWNDLGKIVTKRDYYNLFSFKIMKTDFAALEKSNMSNIEYNEDNYIKYFNVEEDMVVFSKNDYLRVNKENNPDLFKNNRLYNIIKQNVENKNIKIYNKDQDDFLVELDIDSIDITKTELLGFIFKEILFYDNNRNILETRIIGIMPILKQNDKKVIPYVIYFPSLRKYLAKEKVDIKKDFPYIKTLDDLLFYRSFAGTFYSEKNIYTPRKITENITSEEKIIGYIEQEHDIWIYNNK